ncbi:TonB-dependent receptor [Hydrogenophaga sp. UC242_50]|uniref:TonB-dependent receptor n=1 Tax=Hydrogenophaga sp. UC242_50 TaxID=3350169 RepID=UPI0036D31C4A
MERDRGRPLGLPAREDRATQRGVLPLWRGAQPVREPGRLQRDQLRAQARPGKQLAPGHLLGATYSEGFRTGGFYVNYNTGRAAYYGPETAQNHELYYKGRFLDERLTLNANLFFTTYKDQQIEIRPDPNNQSYRETSNAASSRAWGFEIEPAFQVNRRFSVSASLGYLHTRFKEFNHASYGDLSGQPFPEAPKWTLGFGGRYQLRNGFFVGGDAKYMAGYVGRFGIAPQDPIDSRFIANAHVGYRHDNWELSLFAENLFDERYNTFIDRDATPIYAQMGPRRSVGVNLRVKF